jgi:hypothetical protein
VPDSSGRSLAERVGAKLSATTSSSPSSVRQYSVPHCTRNSDNRGAIEAISVGELWGYFTRYVYLPRLVRRETLDSAIERSLNSVLVDGEKFAIATAKDTDSGRYRGLIVPPAHNAALQVTDSTLLVDWNKADEQASADRAAAAREAARRAAEGAAELGPGGHRPDR